MSECKDTVTPCKDKVKSKIQLYLIHRKNESYTKEESELTKKQLMEVLKFTEPQCEAAMGFATDLGKCIIFEGPFDVGVTYAQILGFAGVNCQLKNVL